jgi:Putative Ig domain.
MNPLSTSVRAICVVCIAAPLFAQSPPQITTTSPLPNAIIGSPYNQTLKATGGFPPYTWSINVDIGQAPPWLSLSPGGTLSGTPSGATGTYTFAVDLIDQQRQTTSKNFSLTVQPPPLAITSTSPLPNGTVNANYSYTLTASGGTPPYSWGLIGSLPAGLNLSPGGQITGTPTTAGTSQFTIVLSDSAKAGARAQFSLTIQPAVLSITTTSPLPIGVVGASYSATLAAAGGVSPYTWTASPGSLPPGLTLASNGSLTGTPATAGVFTFAVQVADNPPQGVPSQTATKTFSLRIVQPVSVTTSSPINATLNASLTVVMTATGGVGLPYVWSVAAGSQLPPGFMLDTISGFLSGTPTTLGTFNFTVQATDNAGGVATKALVMIVQAGLAITTASPAPNAAVGMSYALTFAATGGYPPLTWTVDSGTLPAGLSLDPATGALTGTPLAAGAFSFVIRATDSLKATATKSFSITINPAGGRLLVSSNALTFGAPAAGDAPAPQNLAVVSTADQPLPFTVQIDGGAGVPKPAWLSAGLLQGSTPARIPVTVDQAGLPPGTYSARILVNITGAPPSIVTVTLTVTAAAPQLDVSPGYLRFAGPVSALAGVEQDLLVRNAGGGGPLSFQASVVDDTPWLSLTSAAGQVMPNAPALIGVVVNAQGLTTGSQRGAIRIDSAAGSVIIPVTLVVRDDGPVIGLDVSGLRFETRQGNGSANVENAAVLNLGSGAVNWQAQILSGADWLTIAGNSGGQSTATASSAVSFTASPGAMAAGGYYALVQISDPDSLNSPQYLTVVLEVKPADASALPQPDPEGLLFVAKAGGAATPPQGVNLFASTAVPVAFHATASSAAAWLTVSPAGGVTSTQSPARVSVSANPANLLPGIYTGEVTFALAATQTESTNVTLVVLPATATLSPAVKTRAAVVGCTPAKLALVQTGLVNSFAAPAGWPTSLAVRLVDDCGSPVPSGQVVATFSNGDPALTMKLTDSAAGLYSATWSPGRVADTVTMTAHASAPNLLAAVSNVTGSVRANQAPVLAANGMVNSVNPVAGAPLAPGTLAQVSGSSLAPSPAQFDSLPLQTTLNGTQVLIGPLAAALVSVSDGLLSLQIPAELQPDKEYPVIVSTSGGLTLPDIMTTAKATPGVMVNPDNSVTALHGADFSAVTADSPAAANETILLSLVGMGATDPPLATGAAAPQDTPATVLTPPTVTVGGEQATVLFAQLTPGVVGIYQIGLVVPGDLQAIDAPVVITQNGVAANKAMLPIQ